MIKVIGFSILFFSIFSFSEELKIPWTDAPPIIDGKMDDICWKNAACAKDFTLFKKAGKPTQQTEVYLCYDAENLYIFWKLYEKHMEKLIYGPPEDMRDLLNFGGDVVELFIDPGLTRKDYYQFCASPLGTRYDMSSKKGANFNPDWNVKTGIYDWGWTVEMAIPFTQLSHKDEYFSTPLPGEKWGINFCRDEGPLHEWSQWVPSMMSFHEVRNFGSCIFLGKKDTPAIKIIKKTLFFGKNEIEFYVENEKNLSFEYSYILKNNGKVVEEKTSKTLKEIKIPYHIKDGGNWEFLIEAYLNNQKFYKGKIFTNLPDLGKKISEIREKVLSAKKKIKEFNHPEKSNIENKIKDIEGIIFSCFTKLKNRDFLNNEEWKDLLKEVKSLERNWDDLKFDIYLVSIYPQKTKKIFEFTTAIASPTEKIYPDTLYENSLSSPVILSLAGNEYESFQILIIPFWKDIKNLKIEFSDLKGKNGKISKENFSIYEIKYVKLQDIDPDDPSLNEYEPDILMPLNSNSVFIEKGKVKSFWVDFYLPSNTPEGKYEGEIIIKGDKTILKRKIYVNSYGFNLPSKSSLENEFWFSLYKWRRFYGTLNYSPSLYEKHAKTLSKYRISSIPADWTIMWDFIKVYYTQDGHFRFDFTALNEFIKIGLKYGSNSYWAALGCNLAALIPFSRPWKKVISEKDGKEIQLKEIPEMNEWIEKFQKGETYWDKNPMYRDFLKSYVENLKKLGIIDISYYEIYDEPNDNSRWLDMLRHHKFLREYVPELKLFDFGVDPTQIKAEKSAIGYIDVWAPHLCALDDEKVLNAIYERKKYGEKFWFYTCSERKDKYGNYSPYLYYHRPYISLRIHPYFAWKFKADGMFIYALSSVPEENIKKKDEKRWPEIDWLDGKWRGCGTLIYPGPDYEIIPSMRLANLRDGLEDYEYFVILNRLLKKVKDKNLVEKIKKELEIEPEIIESIYVWTKDISVLNKKRERIFKLIKEIKKEVGNE